MAGWIYYGGGPGHRGDFSFGTSANINDKATPNPLKSKSLILSAYLGWKEYTHHFGVSASSIETLLNMLNDSKQLFPARGGN